MIMMKNAEKYQKFKKVREIQKMEINKFVKSIDSGMGWHGMGWDGMDGWM